MTKVVIEPLGSDNYGSWSVRIKALMQLKGLWEPIEHGPTEENVEEDAKALGCIQLNVCTMLDPTLAPCKSAKEAWDALKQLYTATSNGRHLQLRRELHSLQQSPSEAVTQYVGRALSLQQQLCAAGFPVDEQDVVISILAGLSKDFEMLTVALGMTNIPIRLNELLAKLIQEEQRHARHDEAEKTAYLASGSSRPAPSTFTKPGGDHPVRKCFYCGMPGHIKAECRQKARDERQRQQQRGRRGSSSSRGGGSSHTYSSRGSGGQGQSRVPEAVALAATSSPAVCQPVVPRPAAASKQQEWVLDSGATCHISNDISSMKNLKPNMSDVAFGNGMKLEATHIGDVDIPTGSGTNILLQDVLYVPKASHSLFSLPRAVDGGARFNFSTKVCKLSHGGRPLTLTRRQASGLFTIGSGASHTALSSIPKETPELWHRRYGHLGYDNLAKLVSGNMVEGIRVSAQDFKAGKEKVCEPCILAKQQRAPFPSSPSVSSSPLQLWHMDLCGPMPVTSLGGSRYFATVLDDFTKLTVVRPIQCSQV
jgi:hypothetical protein